MRAMAMRIRFLRKISSKMMTTSTIARMITAQQGKKPINTIPETPNIETCVPVLTEGQPGLPDLQVDREVCLDAQVTNGDISARFSLQAGKFHVTVENT